MTERFVIRWPHEGHPNPEYPTNKYRGGCAWLEDLNEPGVVQFADGGAPEDQILCRDLKTLVDALNMLSRQLDDAKEKAELYRQAGNPSLAVLAEVARERDHHAAQTVKLSKDLVEAQVALEIESKNALEAEEEARTEWERANAAESSRLALMAAMLKIAQERNEAVELLQDVVADALWQDEVNYRVPIARDLIDIGIGCFLARVERNPVGAVTVTKDQSDD